MRVASIITYFIIQASIAHGQIIGSDSLVRNNAILLARQSYQATISGNSQVFNGAEFIDPLQKKTLDGDPYFQNDEWQDGFVFYDDQLYENVSLRYHIFQNKLLIEHIQSHAPIELILEKVKYFGIGNHTFVRLSNATDQSEIREGFYDLLYNGNMKVYAKRYKTINEIIDQKTLVTKLTDKARLFLYKDNQYIPIASKASAMNAFGEDKSMIKKFVSQQNINFRTNPEIALIAIANYYDDLKK